MGQKVNPISMRLQVNKDWRSKWFANKRDYATKLTDDLKVRKLIDKQTGKSAQEGGDFEWEREAYNKQ